MPNIVEHAVHLRQHALARELEVHVGPVLDAREQHLHAFAPQRLIGGARRATIRHGLLKGIDPLLTAELLYALRRAGHGDVIAVVDCNFPAVEVATKTTTGTLVELACDCPTALDAIASVDGFGLSSQARGELAKQLQSIAGMRDSSEQAWAYRRIMDSMLSGRMQM